MSKTRFGRLLPRLIALLALVACASDRPASVPPPTDPDLLAARAVVGRLDGVIKEILRNADELGYQGRYERLAPVVREIFEIRTMARGTLGDHWASLRPEQQNEWVELFARFHTSALAEQHSNYRGQSFVHLGERKDERGLVLVSILLDFPGRDVDIRTDYRLRASPRGWLIVDVLRPPTVSDVAMRRAEYATVYEAGGFEKIVERMEQAIARRAERGS